MSCSRYLSSTPFRVSNSTSHRSSGHYGRLLADPVYLRYALSQAFALGGLQVFVFGAPAVLVRALGGTLTDFLVLQGAGIAQG